MYEFYMTIKLPQICTNLGKFADTQESKLSSIFNGTKQILRSMANYLLFISKLLTTTPNECRLVIGLYHSLNFN